VNGWTCRRPGSDRVVRGLFSALVVVVAAAAPLASQAPPSMPAAPTAGATLRIAVYNIKHGQGMDGTVDLERVADVLRPLNADVITLQEIDRGTQRTDGVDQAARLGALLGMEAHFGGFMPYRGGEYGMAVLTRLPVEGVANVRLPDGEEPRTSLVVRVAVGPDETPVSVAGIHFYRTLEERLAQARALTDHFRGVDHAVVLAGDFNSRRGDSVLSHFLDGWSVLPKEGNTFTYPSDEPAREIDFVMVRPARAFDVIEHRVLEERLASDHRPLLAVLRVR